MKLGLSFGVIEWGIVGKEWQSFYFRGPGIDQCAESQMHATIGEIVLDAQLQAELPPTVHATAHGAKGYFLLSSQLAYQVALFPPPDSSKALSKEVLSRFLPQSVIEFNEEGEFRSVVSIFCSFMGVEDHEAMDQFSTIFLDLMANFSGYFKEVDFGDKGGVLVGFFGAPVSFENNVGRALEFVSTLQEEFTALQLTTKLAYRIGITSGVGYTGMVGGNERCQYAAVGNRVNLAARLMTHADWGEVLVDEEVRKTRLFSFKHKGDITYKGVPGPVPTYIFLGRNLEQEPAFAGAMVGRDQELTDLTRFSMEVFQQQHPGVAFIFGEAGIGKSRLIFEVRKKLANAYPISWLTCLADQILRKPFNAFIYCLKNYFDQAPEYEPATNLKHFEQWFADLLGHLQKKTHPEAPVILRELQRTKPILAALVGLKTEDTIWQSLDAQGRYQNTIAAISTLFLAESLIQPTVIELEDGHWLEESSKDLLEQFLPRMASFPILFLLTARYGDDGSKPQILAPEKITSRNIAYLETDLNILTPEVLRDYTEKHLKGEITEEFFELLQRTTNGNPFFLEQLLEYFTESNLLEKEQGHWHIRDNSIRLSNSIQSILTARIDRLSALVRETVKAAAVIGREFEVPVLNEVMRNQEAFSRANGNTTKVLQEQIKLAEKSQIWRAMNELRYIFKHSLLREAVYDMQLRTRLRELHLLIAGAIEKIYSTQLEDHYLDLAFHFEQAEVLDKTMEYLQKAAEHARLYYQNQQALTCYDKLLEFLEEDVEDKPLEIQTLLSKGKILELTGKWDEANAAFHRALTLSQAAETNGSSAGPITTWATSSCCKANTKMPGLYLEVSASFFETTQDIFGIAKVYGDLGNLFFRQGNYESAKSYFTQSINTSRELEYSSSFTQIVANLALAHMNQGHYDEGLRWLQAQLELAQENQDKQGMATLYTNMGIVNFGKRRYRSRPAIPRKRT
ncbi:MAG: AAA family ATPase [Saprospirales bacterium]|nr:AAA family ATPase [Saprospirales bacterium]